MTGRLSTVDDRYVDVSRGLTPATNISALAITVLIIASVAGDAEKLAYALGLHAILMPMNMFVTARLLPRYGPPVEIWRTIANQALSAAVYPLIGFPVAVWLWLPFCGLAYDQDGGKHSFTVLAITCGGQSATAIACGVSPVYPIAFTALAAICWMISSARLRVIRDMLAVSERQRGELARAHAELKAEVAMRHEVELELRQAQKLEAIGRLAAGVAHEINTPMQFVGDSLCFISEGIADVISVNAAYAAARDGEAAALAAAATREREVDIDYLTRELPEAIALATDGVRRMAAIVRSMKQFARHGDDSHGTTDLNAAIETTLTIARHEYKLVADIDRRLGNIPTVICNAGEMNQVLLNLVLNAAHAIQDKVGKTGARGTITIETRVDGDGVVVSVTDTGAGIPDAVRPRIFEPFFTTKAVGRGTGQGLAIARAVIERHHGCLGFDSTLGRGTTFTIRLPIGAGERLAA